MTDTKKIKRTASVLFSVASLVLLWFTIQAIRGFVLNTATRHTANIVIFSIGVLIVLSTLVIALVLLFSTRRDETPFNLKNIKRLKAIALLLVVLEPHMLLSQWVLNKYSPIVLSDNITVSVHTSLGGGVFVAGLVVYCIALVFEYGISLQKQVDETL